MKIKTRTIGAVAVAAAFVLPAIASAHVTVSPQSAPAEGYTKLDLSVPHGCEDAPTNKITIQMPDQVIGATPQVVAGWKITIKEGKLPKPAEAHGEQITEGVREVTWTATGAPLDPHQLQEFGLSVNLAGKAGETAYFKTIQECVDGSETAWIEIPAEGSTDEPEHPAPAVELTAPVAEHGDAADEQKPSESNDHSEGGSDTIAIIALVVAALGLVAGATAIVLTRRK